MDDKKVMGMKQLKHVSGCDTAFSYFLEKQILKY